MSVGFEHVDIVDAIEHVDLADLAARFGDRLHAAGMPVPAHASGRFAAALALACPQRVDQLYWLARVTLVTDRQYLDAFQRVFDDVFRGVPDSIDATRNPNTIASTRPSDQKAPQASQRPPTDPSREGESRRTVVGGGDGQGGEDGDSEGLLAASSDEERLRSQPFGVCTSEELIRLYALMSALRIEPPLRVSRRTRGHRAGRELDLRATLRAAGRSGGDPVRQIRRRRRVRHRRVVLIADVSGSMESYGRAYLYLLHGAVRAIGAEAFVFATRLHRLTRPLALHHPAHALARAMAAAPDWSGGTRIGQALKTFNDDHARRGLARGAIVVIVSDGWERSDVALLGQEMQRLSRLAHRIVWVNPRKQTPGYQPLVGGMAAALPHVDQFLSGHSLTALEAVVTAICCDVPRRRRPAGVATTASAPGSGIGEVPSGVVPPTSMRPDYGTVTRLSRAKVWNFAADD